MTSANPIVNTCTNIVLYVLKKIHSVAFVCITLAQKEKEDITHLFFLFNAHITPFYLHIPRQTHITTVNQIVEL